MRQKAAFVIAYWWIMILGVIGLALLIFADKEPRESETENRILQGMPRITFESMMDGTFMSGLEDFLSDKFFFRDSVTYASSELIGIFSVKTEESLYTADDMSADIWEQMENTGPSGAWESGTGGEQEATDEPAQPDETAQPGGDTDPDAGTLPDDDESQTSEGIVLNGPYTFWMELTDGSRRTTYRFPDKNIITVIKTLNAYRQALPEDGTVHFIQLPFPQIANSLIYVDDYCGWGSDVEDAIQANADDGVYVHSATKILEPHILNGEYIYFRTDHHWASRGAYYVHAAMMEAQGLAPTDYDDYDYTIYEGFLGTLYSENPSALMRSRADTIELMTPISPVHSYVTTFSTLLREVPLVDTSRRNYQAYLQSTQGPWRKIVSGFHTGRKALIISDSYGNVFAPYMLPYYDELHMTDLRDFSNSSKYGKVKAYIENNGIDDVYIILSTASGINSSYMLLYLMRYFE